MPKGWFTGTTRALPKMPPGKAYIPSPVRGLSLNDDQKGIQLLLQDRMQMNFTRVEADNQPQVVIDDIRRYMQAWQDDVVAYMTRYLGVGVTRPKPTTKTPVPSREPGKDWGF